MTRRAPAWAMGATAPLRRPTASLSWSAVRLVLVAAAVLGVYLWVRSFDPRWWAAAAIAAGPAVLGSPVVILAVQRIRQGRRQSRAIADTRTRQTAPRR